MSQSTEQTTPTPAPTTPPPAAPAADDLDPTFKLLFEAAESEKKEPAPEAPSGKSLHEVVADPTAAPSPEKAPEIKAAATPASAETAAPKEEPKKVRVRRRSEATPVAPAAPVTPATTPAPEPPKKSDDQIFEEGLLDEERDQLALARYAEEKDPTKYKGYAAKVTKFLKDHAAYLEKNPKATEAGSDEAEAYQVWLAKNNVALPAREARQWEVRREAERIADEKLKESEGRFAELHDDNFRRDREPAIKREADEFFNKLAAEALPADLLKSVKEVGLEKAKAAHPLEYRIAAEEMTQTAADVEEFRRITTQNPRTGRALKPFDPNNAQHARILGFIRGQCDLFKNGSADETPAQRATRTRLLVQDGKQFLTRDEYFSLKPEQRTPYWTFRDDQIVQLAGLAAKSKIAGRIKDENNRREAEGWVRKAAAAAAPNTTTLPSGAPPAPRVAPISAHSSSGDEKPDKAFTLLMGE